MQRLGLWTMVVCVALAGCRSETSNQSVNRPEDGAGDAPIVALADYVVGEPLAHGNLTIFPIASKKPLADDRFITLDEGLKAGTVKVYEVGAEGESGDGPNAPPTTYPQLSPNPGVDDSINVPDDPRAAAPQPPTVDEDAADETEAQPPTPSTEPQVFQTAGEPQQIDADDVTFAQENLDLQFAQQSLQQGGGREVNRLMVVNTSDKPLYLMPGEVIIGGSQDRTIGQELVIAPGGEPVAVDVFCVEHERWHDRSVDATVAQLAVASRGLLRGSIAVEDNVDADEAAQEISKGKFIASVGCLNTHARKALQQTGAQGEVWDAVAVQNATSKVATGGATFSANYSDAEFVGQLEPYVEALHEPVAQQENVIGVIVAVDGKVASMDVFESTPLFQKLWPKLLKSYALDAATHAAGEKSDASANGETQPKSVALTVADAQTFLEKARSGEITKSEKSGDLAVTARQAQGVICFTSRQPVTVAADAAEAAPADAAEAMGGFGGGVHTSAFAH